MLNKKTIAIKQDVKGIITRGISDMTPAELARIKLAMDQVLASRTLYGFLSQIGRVYEVPFSDERKTTAVMLTLEGIRSLGIDLDAVFKGCGGEETFNEATDVKNGVLVNLDLYQQVALLRAILERKPELASVIGLYNLRASRRVYEVLNRENVHNELDIYWIWTGEKWIRGIEEGSYPKETVVTLRDLESLEGNRFCYRNVNNDYWNDHPPDSHGPTGAVVFGAQN